MKKAFSILTTLCLVVSLALMAADAPAKLTFKSKFGDVAYDHTKHSDREKKDCKVCHDKPWPQSATAPLNFKSPMHKANEAKKESCAMCHVDGGKAFAAKGNCTKCHAKKGAAK